MKEDPKKQVESVIRKPQAPSKFRELRPKLTKNQLRFLIRLLKHQAVYTESQSISAQCMEMVDKFRRYKPEDLKEGR